MAYTNSPELIPTSFVIANNIIKVIVGDIDNVNNRYGDWDSATNEIHIYRKVKSEGIVVTLTNEQLYNTFFHEVIHCFQFYAGMEMEEREAQTFANFIREYQATAKFN